MQPLKLAALDEEDLQVLSAHLQDAVLRVADMAYLPGQHRFAAVINRFDWEGALTAEGAKDKKVERRRSALRFDRVLGAQLSKIRMSARSAVLELLAIRFEADEPPGGYVTLYFAGGGAIRLQVECIEAELQDLGPAWRASRTPEHEEAGDEPSRS